VSSPDSITNNMLGILREHGISFGVIST